MLQATLGLSAVATLWVAWLDPRQVAALAEFRRHQADHRNLLLVKLGTGVGAGVVLNGSLYKGEHSAAGEIGHIVVRRGGARP